MKKQFLNILVFVIFICSCNKNPHRHIVEYYPTGEIRQEFYVLDNGNVDSLKTDYYLSGQIWAKSMWHNGFLNGNAFEYYQNGQVKQQSYFIMDNPFGWHILYDSLGVITHKYDYALRPNEKLWLVLSEEQLLNFDRYEEGKVGELIGY